MSRLYHLEFSKIVLKFFTKHPDIEQRFFEKIPQLQKNPFDTSLDIRALQ